MKPEPKKKILVVEDDECAALIAEKTLEKYFSVRTAPNGYAALNAIEMTQFDAVLMDINLGDDRMDGLNTMRQIRSNRKHRRLKIFAITAFSDTRDWYINQGFDDLIIKPINEKKTTELINSKINNYVTGRSLFSKSDAA